MKKLTLTIVSVVAITGAALAQGTLSWNTIAPNGMTAQTNSTAYSPLMGGGTTGSGAVGVTTGSGTAFYYELLYNTSFTGSQIAAPTLAQLTGGSWIDSALEATNSSSAGKLGPIANNTAAVPQGTWVGGIGTLGGTTNNIVLVGWSANLGTSWSVVSGELANWNTVKGNFAGNSFFGETTTEYIDRVLSRITLDRKSVV